MGGEGPPIKVGFARFGSGRSPLVGLYFDRRVGEFFFFNRTKKKHSKNLVCEKNNNKMVNHPLRTKRKEQPQTYFFQQKFSI